MYSLSVRAAALSIAIVFSTVAAQSQANLEKATVTVAMGGRATFPYLPVTIAMQRGFFKEQGLTVEAVDLSGGVKQMEALVGGGADIAIPVLQQVVSLRARGQPIKSFVNMTDNYGVFVVLPKDKAGAFKSFADMKGKTLGVTGPGGGSHISVLYLMKQAGLGASDVSAIGVGTGSAAVAAFRAGKVDAMSMTEPAITILGDSATIVADVMTKKGARERFGGLVASLCAVARDDFIARNPKTVQAFTNGILKALIWLKDATPAQVADSVPPGDLQGGRDVYEKAFAGVRDNFSFDGITARDAAARAVEMLKLVDEKVAGSQVDVAAAYTNEFVEKGLASLKTAQ